MKKNGRYAIKGLDEAEFEPGSGGRVLKNLLGIKSKREMDQVEAREQLRAVDELVEMYGPNHRFTSKDVCKIHEVWLGPIYPWAGRYRQVNLSKGQFPFAGAMQIPILMENLENGPLRKYTPCNYKDVELRLMGAVLGKAAKECQIVIFTCVPDRYGNVGEATVVAIG